MSTGSIKFASHSASSGPHPPDDVKTRPGDALLAAAELAPLHLSPPTQSTSEQKTVHSELVVKLELDCPSY